MNQYLFNVESETFTPTPGVLLADHFIKPFGFYGHRSNGTRDWLMIYTVAGQGSFRVSTEVKVSGPGDVVIIPPGIPHHYATNESGVWDLLWVHFVPIPEWHPWLQLPRTEEGLISLAVQDHVTRRIERAFDNLIIDSKRGGKWDQDLALISLSEILLLLFRQTEQDRMTHRDERIELILTYIHENFHTSICLQDLAAMVGLSVSRLSHLYKLRTEETIGDTVKKMRLQRSVKLLEITSRSVSEIAYEVGYGSPFYFSRLFTRAFGVNPSEYRSLAQQKWGLPVNHAFQHIIPTAGEQGGSPGAHTT